MPRRLANRILKLAASAFDSLGSGTFLARDSADNSIKVVYQEAGDAIPDVTLLDANQRIPSTLLMNHVVDPGTPYPVAAGVRRITTSATMVVELPEVGFNNGELLMVVNSSAAGITVSGDPQGTDQLDGGAGTVAINVGAHGACGFLRRAAGDWRSVQLGASDLTGPRAIYVSVEGGVLGWKEQVLVGGTWQDVSAHAALTTELDGGVTLSGTTYTIPMILALTTNPHLSDDKRYVAFSSCSAELQAMVATGTFWSLELGYDSIAAVAHGRIGAAVVRTAGGAFDAGTENDSACRVGWTGSAYQSSLAGGSAAWGGTTSGALAMRLLRWIGSGSPASAIIRTGASAWTVGSTGSGLATVPDRLYVLANAAGVMAGTCAVGNPRVRLVFNPWATFAT